MGFSVGITFGASLGLTWGLGLGFSVGLYLDLLVLTAVVGSGAWDRGGVLAGSWCTGASLLLWGSCVVIFNGAP